MNAPHELERLEMVYNLHQSMTNKKDFFLQYQPQIDGNTNLVYGAEALIRWNYAGSIISPIKFIPIAETTKQIIPIGEFVFREACRKSMEWKLMGLGGKNGLKVNVNISPIQLTRELVKMIFSTMAKFDLSPQYIGLELTESYLVGPEAIAIVHELHASGMSIAIDDFGTGYSCLSGLKNFPIDTIKIDKSFISDIGSSTTSSHIVKAIIDLAQNLGMITIAEGVETWEQKTILEQMGCHRFQGYLFSKPISDVELVRYVRDQVAWPVAAC